jgi:hypothetical protein
MHRLLARSPEPDPERYTRVPCEACEGTGWLMSGGDMYLIKGMPSVCSSCDGTGRAMEMRDADVLPDTPEEQASTAKAAREVDGGESSREVLAFDDGDNPDMQVATTSPSPPQGGIRRPS